MNLSEFTDGTPTTKPSFTFVLKSVTVDTATVNDAVVTGVLDVNEVQTGLLSLLNTASVPNPPVGSVTFFSTGTDLKSTDPLGDTNTFLTTGNCGMFVTPEQLSGVANQAQPVAPAGLRDSWQAQTGLTFNGGILFYDQKDDMLYASDPLNVDVGGFRSIDGGATFTPVVFDVAPTGYVAFSADGAGHWVGLSSMVGDPAYISSDGLNFVAQAVPASGGQSINIIWNSRLGLFIAGLTTGATSWIATSPTGAVWTQRTTPDFGASPELLQFAQNASIIVCTVDNGGSPVWSVDGITWTAGTALSPTLEAITWSQDRSEFLTVDGVSHIGYTSTDGKIWTSLGSVSSHGPSNGLIWVGGDIQRYYLAEPTFSPNYSMSSAGNPALGFSAAELDGATAVGQDYGMVAYLPAYNRFVLGVDTPVGVAYSTARPYDIKAVSDNIRVRGAPVHVNNYSTWGDASVKNTLVETNISTASGIGSLTLEAPIPAASVIRFELAGVASSTAGDTLTIRIYTNGALLLTHAITIPALAADKPVLQWIKVVPNPFGGCQIFSQVLVSAISNVIIAAAPAFDITAQNVFTITGQWGANVNNFDVLSLTMDTGFRNGP